MQYRLLFAALVIMLYSVSLDSGSYQRLEEMETIKVKKTADFELNGAGTHDNWARAEWIELPQRKTSGESLKTEIKTLYSETGIYFLFQCQDRKITSTMEADFMDLWTEDVVEVFLWPDESFPTYFEYEISPMDYELPILISNHNGDLVRWRPFHYDKDRQTRHATSVKGGEKKSNAAISSWTAEFFIPYKLLRPLTNVPPESGTKWRANFYRVDYDQGQNTWSWKRTDKSFHEHEKFGVLLFD